jgi:hypothetical protein
VVVATITRMGGTIATVTPDQILALFGYPEAHEDDAERAVDAGLDAVTKIDQFRWVKPVRVGDTLSVRVTVLKAVPSKCSGAKKRQPHRASGLMAPWKHSPTAPAGEVKAYRDLRRPADRNYTDCCKTATANLHEMGH